MLSALLAKVQGVTASAAPAAAPAAPAAAAPSSLSQLQQQEQTIGSHLRHWDEQYRLIWPQHNSARQAIAAIEADPNPYTRSMRANELLQHQQQAEHFAQQLRQVQAQQASLQQQMQQLQTQKAQMAASSGSAAPGSADPRMLVVTGLSPLTSEASLRQLFSQLGSLLHCQLVVDPATGQSAQHAFVSFAEEAQSAHVQRLAAQGQIALDGRGLQVAPAAGAAPASAPANHAAPQPQPQAPQLHVPQGFVLR